MLPERRHGISRLEGFSDAVFAFVLTLLVVSLEVPRSYAKLIELVRGFPSFACCFALLVWIWHEHNMYFRRYGLQDGYTVFLNAVLLFVVMFYVYPLKFMFDSMFRELMPAQSIPVERMTFVQLSRASAIYGFGFIVLFIMFAALYWHAYRKREELGLTPLELFDVRAYVGHHLVSAAVGLVVVIVALALPPRMTFVSPMCFGLMGPAHWAWGAHAGRRRRVLETRFGAEPARPA
jgi:uncharacterized membrane protein